MAGVTDNFTASAPHTQDKTGSLKTPSHSKKKRGRGGGRGNDAASRWGINAQEGRTQRDGRQASLSLCQPQFPCDGQGTEFNKSFRKLSGSVISDKRPATSRNSEKVSTGMNSSWKVFRALSAAS